MLLFTIAIPTYNRAGLLKRAIKSALDQTYTDFEVLVSDNASTDDTPKLLASMPVRVVRQITNVGIISNWNTCLREARGRYVVILSDDDLIEPDFLQRAAAVLEPGVSVIVGLTNRMSKSGLSPAIRSKRLKTGIHDGPEVLIEILKGRITQDMCCTAMHREELIRAGGFPDGLPFSTDRAALIPLLMRGKAGFINQTCGTYALHEASQTSAIEIETRLLNIEAMVNRAIAYDNPRTSAAARYHMALSLIYLKSLKPHWWRYLPKAGLIYVKRYLGRMLALIEDQKIESDIWRERIRRHNNG